MLRDSVVVVVVGRKCPRAILLAMITMRKSTHGFPFVSHIRMLMELRLATEAPLGRRSSAIIASVSPTKITRSHGPITL